MRAIPLVFFMLLTACMGAVGPNPGPSDDDDDQPTESARELYISGVHPIMARCGGNGCHEIGATASGALGKFYTADAAAGYTAIRGSSPTVGDFSAIAPIITKIDAGHLATYTSADRNHILDWLAAEVSEQQDNPNLPPPVDSAALLRDFSACMTQANFDLAEMPLKMGNANASNGQACKNCHPDGAFGFVTNPDSLQYFTTLSTSMSQLVKYFGVTNGAVSVSTGALNNAGTAIIGHPPFTTEQLAGYAAITQFYDLTKTAVTAGNCGPPKAVNP